MSFAKWGDVSVRTRWFICLCGWWGCRDVMGVLHSLTTETLPSELRIKPLLSFRSTYPCFLGGIEELTPEILLWGLCCTTHVRQVTCSFYYWSPSETFLFLRRMPTSKRLRCQWKGKGPGCSTFQEKGEQTQKVKSVRR